MACGVERKRQVASLSRKVSDFVKKFVNGFLVPRAYGYIALIPGMILRILRYYGVGTRYGI